MYCEVIAPHSIFFVSFLYTKITTISNRPKKELRILRTDWIPQLV